MRGSWEKAITVGFIGLIVFTALAHGAVEPWSEFLLVLWMTALGVMWAFRIARAGKLLLYVPANWWPLAAFFLLGLAQSIAFRDPSGKGFSLSLDVEATRGACVIIGCLLMASLLSANFLAHRERLLKLAQFLTIFGLVLATFALIQHFTWNDRFYWLRPANTEVPFGPFVNRNHFAGYMELLLPWPMALLLTGRRSPAEKFFYIFVMGWMALAAIFSLSRGGMISIFAELMFLAAMAPRQAKDEMSMLAKPRSQAASFIVRGGAVLAIVLVTLGGLTWLGAEQVINRITTSSDINQAFAQNRNFNANRDELWRDSWTIFRANPLTGTGMGAFETALPIYGQGRNLGLVTSQTHNDYLQILTDTGIIGGLITLWFLLATTRAIWRGLRVREPLMNNIVLACGAALFGILVHSLFDFNLQLPSHALLFVCFSALVAQLSELAKIISTARVARLVAVPE